MLFFLWFLVGFCTSREYTESVDTAVLLFFFFGTEDGLDWGYYGVMAGSIGLHQNSFSHTTAAAGSVGLPGQSLRARMSSQNGIRCQI